MSKGRIFTNNRTQNVHLPADVRFPDSVTSVYIRVNGNERVLTPFEETWDSFFIGGESVSDDFLPTRPNQHQSERETF